VQYLENIQQQNKQIQLLSEQLTDAHNQIQQLQPTRQQQRQQVQRSRNDDVKQGLSSTPVLINGSSAGEVASKPVAEPGSRVSQVRRLRNLNVKIMSTTNQTFTFICNTKKN